MQTLKKGGFCMNPSILFVSTPAPFLSPDLTWIGPASDNGSLCLGFDDGSIRFLSPTTGLPLSKFLPISPSKEAVNGFAAIGARSFAVSTRADITFVQIVDPPTNSRAVFPGGAHNVIATPSGYFVAALGAKGILITKPDNSDEQRMHLTTGSEGNLYFYKSAVVSDSDGNEELIFANRKGGIGFCPFKGTDSNRVIHAVGFDGLDVVDVCGIGAGSPSAIAISTKGQILWIKNAMQRQTPTATQLVGIEGRVYRILATQDHLFVLTNEALYFWPNLIEELSASDKSSKKGQSLRIPMNAVDMSLSGKNSILLVMTDNAVGEAMFFDESSLSALPQNLSMTNSNDAGPAKTSWTNEFFHDSTLEEFLPAWEHQNHSYGNQLVAV
jgi:hypothetical protein